LSKCKYEYKPRYINEITSEIPLDCKEQFTENGDFCIFHDKSHYIEQEAAKRFEEKVKSINQNEPLVCFGYYLPGINFANLLEGKNFSQPVYFNEATFSKEANFGGAKFLDEVYFRENEFKGKTFFRNVTFEQQNKVKFDDNDLSNVSFADSDITRIRFGGGVTWRGDDKFTIIEEEWLREKAGGQTKPVLENVSLELVLSVYRNLRENYEFRLRYDDAGKLFIKEMELKRNYREVPSISDFKLKLISLSRRLRLKWNKSPIPQVTYRLKKMIGLEGIFL
jgi:hypothetical protein